MPEYVNSCILSTLGSGYTKYCVAVSSTLKNNLKLNIIFEQVKLECCMFFFFYSIIRKYFPGILLIFLQILIEKLQQSRFTDRIQWFECCSQFYRLGPRAFAITFRPYKWSVEIPEGNTAQVPMANRKSQSSRRRTSGCT